MDSRLRRIGLSVTMDDLEATGKDQIDVAVGSNINVPRRIVVRDDGRGTCRRIQVAGEG